MDFNKIKKNRKLIALITTVIGAVYLFIEGKLTPDEFTQLLQMILN